MLHPYIAETGRKQPPNTENEGNYEKGRIPGSFPLKKRVFGYFRMNLWFRFQSFTKFKKPEL